MTEQPYKKPVFPDLQLEKVKKQIESKEWGNCPKCDWWYKFTVLERCPMCRYAWRNGKSFTQPPFESPSLS